jgi:DNA adenine methylase
MEPEIFRARRAASHSAPRPGAINAPLWIINRHEMTDAQHVALLALLRERQGQVMISGYASELYDDLLADWRRLTRQHYAAADCGAKVRTEVLWIKPG